MGPVEVVFLIVIAIFGAIGVVRGYQRELGVTTMLLLALFLITFLTARAFGERIDSVLQGADLSQAGIESFWALMAVLLLIFVAFISYQGWGLAYPGSGKNNFVSLLVGLVNGYLLAGSIWFYLATAGWPFSNVVEPFSPFYEFAVKILPPALFGWQFFILLAVAMLIIRVAR